MATEDKNLAGANDMHGLSAEELEAEAAAELPDREAMTLINPPSTIAPIEWPVDQPPTNPTPPVEEPAIEKQPIAY